MNFSKTLTLIAATLIALAAPTARADVALNPPGDKTRDGKSFRVQVEVDGLENIGGVKYCLAKGEAGCTPNIRVNPDQEGRYFVCVMQTSTLVVGVFDNSPQRELIGELIKGKYTISGPTQGRADECGCKATQSRRHKRKSGGRHYISRDYTPEPAPAPIAQPTPEPAPAPIAQPTPEPAPVAKPSPAAQVDLTAAGQAVAIKLYRDQPQQGSWWSRQSTGTKVAVVLPPVLVGATAIVLTVLGATGNLRQDTTVIIRR